MVDSALTFIQFLLPLVDLDCSRSLPWTRNDY
jgi:hypothetical protein